MTVPSPFVTDFLTVSLTGITDVQTIIDEFIDNITLDLPVDSRWTDLGGSEFRSPIQDVGGANRFLTVTITRTSATRIAWVVRDQNGNIAMDGTFDISGTASARIYVGPFHAAIETLHGATVYEHGIGFLCDPAPYTLNTSPNYVVGRTRRSAAGGELSSANDQWMMNDSAGASTPNARAGGVCTTSSSNVTNGVTTGGSVATLPLDISTRLSASVRRWAGRGYQFVQVPLSILVGTEVDVPLDDVTTGTFRVLGLNQAGSTVMNTNIAVRVA